MRAETRRSVLRGRSREPDRDGRCSTGMRARLLLSGSLAAAALLFGTDRAAAGGGGCGDSAPVVPVAANKVAMTQFCFEPGVVTIAPGETMEIVNDDPMLHNIYGPGWFHGDLRPGEVMSRTFDQAGTYTFACTLHPGMTGAVVVSDIEPISATSPVSNNVSGTPVALLVGIGLALLIGLGTGWTVGWVTRHSDDVEHHAPGLVQTTP